ncbi:MAG: PaaI family thioesterase [Caulobacterales bacterium]
MDDALKPDAVAASIARIPYARFLGIDFEVKGDELTLVMPYSEHLLGRPNPPALHGGVIGALLEIVAIAQVTATSGVKRAPKTIDVTVSYLRSGRPVDTYARAHISRLGRRIANARAEAWQSNRFDPIATLHGNFLLRADEP